ncbi:MAG: ATPase [Acidimicrobiales bacterium]|nr:MAG: ATPase [Acidimicrobiales bacterium]
MNETNTTPAYPTVIVQITNAGVLVNGETINVPAGTPPQVAAVRYIAHTVAKPLNRPVRVVANDPQGQTRLVVHPDGHGSNVEQLNGSDPAAKASVSGPPPTQAGPLVERIIGHQGAPGGVPIMSPWTDALIPAALTAPARPQQAEPVARYSAPPRAVRSFLADPNLTTPALTGFAAVLAKLGIKTGPDEEELSRRAEERAVSQHWPGPRTVAVLNGKGGAGKTPAAVLLSALFARGGGSGVLAWDNNVTRGTLGWRTEKGPHDATILDLLPYTERLLEPGARAADLDGHVHHQPGDRFDVLRSNPLLLSTEQKLTPDQLDAVHAVVTKYYRIVVMDSGNDEGDALWLRMVDHANQIVVPTTTRADHAEAARLLLDALRTRDGHSAGLADGAVVIVSQADKDEADAGAIAEGFRDLARAVVTVPYDPAMRAQWLRYEGLARQTKRAYLRAAAKVAAGF